MPRLAKESVAPEQESSAGWMLKGLRMISAAKNFGVANIVLRVL